MSRAAARAAIAAAIEGWRDGWSARGVFVAPSSRAYWLAFVLAERIRWRRPPP